ncbi:MAG: AzlC family ABC transporter permease, partial [Acetobacteraceae bacterium]|nr:AzlC family ABC transporter permease [Acetobacteraceae bacterium]
MPAPVPLEAARAALAAPAIALAATFVAFGAAAAAAGMGLAWTLACGLLVFGMPGQLVLLQAGGGLAAVPAALFANSRFLPMAIAIAPLFGPWRGRTLLASPFIAVTPWAAGLRSLPGIVPEQRLTWFVAFGLVCFADSAAGMVAGHALGRLLEGGAQAALVFVNPLYFALLIALDLRRPGPRAAALCGAAAALPCLWLPPGVALLAAGV